MKFDCSRCGVVCKTEVACWMHERACVGRNMQGSRRECGECGEWMSRANFARHVRTCGVREGEATVGEEERSERTRGRVAECQWCRRTLSYTNMARHERSCRWLWDPGGGSSS